MTQEHETLRDQITVLRKELKQFTPKDGGEFILSQEQYQRKISVETEIKQLRKQLGKTDKAIEKKYDKEQKCKEQGQANLAALCKMDRYILKSTKHIKHLIEATESGDQALEHEHFHRLKSRYEHLMELIEDYDKKYRN